VKIECPSCQQPIELPDEAEGHSVECPTCLHFFMVEKKQSRPVREEKVVSEADKILFARHANKLTAAAKVLMLWMYFGLAVTGILLLVGAVMFGNGEKDFIAVLIVGGGLFWPSCLLGLFGHLLHIRAELIRNRPTK
jgi:uncharacterized paraquat-inducible protein A